MLDKGKYLPLERWPPALVCCPEMEGRRPAVAQLESRSLDFQQYPNSFSCYLSQLNDLSLCVGRPGSSLKCGACPCPHRSPLVLLLASEMSRIKGPQRGVRWQEGARLVAGQLLRVASRGRCGTELAAPELPRHGRSKLGRGRTEGGQLA